MKMYRQGDLLFKKITEFPETRLVKFFVEGNEAILVSGETTGHSHKLNGDFDFYRDETQAMYFEVRTKAKVTHEEHKTIKLEKGKYALIRQREYTPEGIVYVTD